MLIDVPPFPQVLYYGEEADDTREYDVAEKEKNMREEKKSK